MQTTTREASSHNYTLWLTVQYNRITETSAHVTRDIPPAVWWFGGLFRTRRYYIMDLECSCSYVLFRTQVVNMDLNFSIGQTFKA